MASNNKKQDENIEMMVQGLVAAFKSPARAGLFLAALFACWYVFTHMQTISDNLGLQGFERAVPFCILLIPLVMLTYWGRKRMTETQDDGTAFKKIHFQNRAGVEPKQIAKYRDYDDRRKIVYEYKSPGMPLSMWIERKNELENALNLTIMNMHEDSKNKQIIVMTTIPSTYRLPVSTRDNPYWWSDTYMAEGEAVVNVGMHLLDPIHVDLNKFPHMLVAGTTGSGKSILIQSLIWQLSYKGARLFLFDFKGGIEFSGIWEQYGTVVTEIDDAISVCNKLYMEQERRSRFLAEDGAKYGYSCKNIKDYNKKHPDNPLSRIVLVVDELGDLMDKDSADKERKAQINQIEFALKSLARKSRAVGINMIFGIQRPDAKVVDSQIRNNVPIKICGRVGTGDGRYLSEIVLGDSIATTLDTTIEGRFYGSFGNNMVQFQSYYFEPEKFVKSGNWQKGRTLIDFNQPLPEECADDAAYYEKLDEVKESADSKDGLDWRTFGKI